MVDNDVKQFEIAKNCVKCLNMAKMVRNSSKSGWICFRMANNGWKWTSKWPKTVQMPENGFTLFKMVIFFL